MKLPARFGGEQSRAARPYPWRHATSPPLSLALSLLFGAGQLVIGGLVAWRIARSGRWRIFGQYLLMLVALWFVWSGISELLVSGMEAARDIFGHPSAAHFAAWRAPIDAALLVVSCVLAVALALYPIAIRLRAASPGAARTTLDGKRAS